MPAWKGAGRLTPEEFLERHGQWNSAFDESALFYYLDEYVKHHAKDMFAVFDASASAIASRLDGERVLLVRNIDMLSHVLDLPEHERKLLLYAALAKYKRDLRAVMVDCKVAHSQEAFQILSGLTGASPADVAASLRPGSRLETLNLIEQPLPENSVTDLGDLMRLSDRLLHVLLGNYANEAEMMAVFTRPAAPPTLTVADYPHVDTDARYLSALLSNATRQHAAGVNVLIYGPPGTGKTEFARCWPARLAVSCMRSIASTATATACPARIVIGRCRCRRPSCAGGRVPRCCSTKSRTFPPAARAS